jgi:magnesium transporter
VEAEERIVRRFLESHPREAARVLERLPDLEVEEILKESEPADVAAIVGAIVTSVASRQIARMKPERAGEVLGHLPSERAAELLRRLEPQERQGLLDAVSPSLRLPIERLLRFPPDSAGSLMEPHFVSLHQSRLVEEAVSELRRQGSDLRHFLYVVDDDLVLVGVLSVREVVTAPPAARLANVMIHPVQTLSARAGRTAIVRHPGWKRFPSLPVVDERGRLVGVFRYRRFRELSGIHDDEDEPGAIGLALALSELFWWGASSLFRGLENETEKEKEQDAGSHR